MGEQDITDISLTTLLENFERRKEDFHYGGCLITSKICLDKNVRRKLFRKPIRLNASLIILCSKGSISLTSNQTHYTLREHAMFINRPTAIIQGEAQEDAEIYVAMWPEMFIQQINVDLKLMTGLLLKVDKNQLLYLDDKEWGDIMHSFSDICTEQTYRSDSFTAEIIRSEFRLLIYRICRVIDHYTDISEITPNLVPHDRHERYFERFVQTLSRHYMQERSVGFYADELNLTPKYLTTVIRKASGRTATDWINSFVILEAKNMLKYSALSIQEIAYRLNFPNQSFFGKYFKNHTGKTPSAYREDD